MQEINEFLGDDGLEDGMQSMEIDQNINGGLVQKRVSGADDQSTQDQNLNRNSVNNNQAARANPQNPDQNAEGNGLPSNYDTNSNFNINRNIPVFLQGPNNGNRNQSAGGSQPGANQGIPQVNQIAQEEQGIQAQSNQVLPRQVQDNRRTAVGGNGGTTRRVFAEVHRPNVAHANLHVVEGRFGHQGFPADNNLIPLHHAVNEFPNMGQGNANRVGDQPGMVNQIQVQPQNLPQAGLNNFHGEPQAHGQAGVLAVRNNNRTSRRSTPYNPRSAAQMRRQNFDNLASLLYSLSKKCSYVRNFDEDNDENETSS